MLMSIREVPIKSRSFGLLIGFFLVLLFVKALTKEVPEVQIKAASLEYSNPNYLEPTTYVRVHRKSRSEALLTVFLPLHRDLPVDANVTYRIYERAHNAWRSTLIKGNVQFCMMIAGYNKLFTHLFAFSNFPHECPVKKGNYTIKDMSLKGIEYPPMPSAEFRIKVTWGTPLAKIVVFFLELKDEKKGSFGPMHFSDAPAMFLFNKTFSSDHH